MYLLVFIKLFTFIVLIEANLQQNNNFYQIQTKVNVNETES